LVSLFASLGCATIASDAGDIDAERPNAQAGPFRALRDDEVPASDGPYLLKGKLSLFREATALDLDHSGAPGQTAIYALATASAAIGVFRFLADDARNFSETPNPAAPVLEASETWEGPTIETPEVAEIEGEIWLFYAGVDGIGAASSSDGVTFIKLPGPLLGAPASGWDAGEVPRAPAVIRLGAGDYRMFYEAGGRIGEATSADGTSWQRIGDAPILEPRAITDPSEPPFDSDSVGDPEGWVATGAEGRRVIRVYYTGRAADGSNAIGMAARFGASGPLTRAVAPAFSGARGPHAPAILPFDELTLLYVTELAGLTDALNYPAIAAGVAPGDVKF
jgi:hypothetical protein